MKCEERRVRISPFQPHRPHLERGDLPLLPAQLPVRHLGFFFASSRLRVQTVQERVCRKTRNPTVRGVNRRIPMRIVRLFRSTMDVEMNFGPGSPKTAFFVLLTYFAGLYRFSTFCSRLSPYILTSMSLHLFLPLGPAHDTKIVLSGRSAAW